MVICIWRIYQYLILTVTRSFTPVYDPAPMRAYSQHDMLSVMPFGNYGDIPEGYDTPVSLHEAITRFAKTCGLSKTQCDETVHSLLTVTQSYTTRVERLLTVPAPNKERLIGRVEEIRKQLA